MVRFILASLTCFLALLAFTNGIPIDEEALTEWDTYSRNFSKPETTLRESELRKRTFISNYAQIKAHNADYEAGLVSFELGINQFTDLTTDEILKYYTGLKLPNIQVANTCQNSSEDELREDIQKRAAPANWDWRAVSPGVLSPIRNQGQCGSCWAFATIASAEAAYNKKQRANLARFSDQHLLDCDTNQMGCDGGYPENALTYAKQKGLISHSSYSGYSAFRSSCKVSYGNFKPASSGLLRNVDDATLRNLIYNYGPVIVGMDGAFFNFQAYRSGVLTPQCSTTNHAVNVVGYATTGPGAPYWILRNSWGPSWGEGGYFRLSTKTPCFIKDNVWYVTF